MSLSSGERQPAEGALIGPGVQSDHEKPSHHSIIHVEKKKNNTHTYTEGKGKAALIMYSYRAECTVERSNPAESEQQRSVGQWCDSRE